MLGQSSRTRPTFAVAMGVRQIFLIESMAIASRDAHTHVPTNTFGPHASLSPLYTYARTCALEISQQPSKQLFHSPDLVTDGAMNAPTAWTHNAAHMTFILSVVMEK